MTSRLIIPDAALAQHVIALGKTRSGKSSKLRLIVEHLLEQKKPVCIIDPKGDWWGLKSSGDGKRAGYPVVIFGGEHADVPINRHSGASVAELIATGNRPCIIDLGGWMVAERTDFFIAFASTLFKHTRGARYLVIDEVHNFAPQGKVLDPNAGKMLHWANRLASEGSGKGITLIAASQRPQKVHKDFVTSCETLIACRVIHKLDRDAIKDWIDGCADPAKGKEVLAELAGMKRNEAWVWSPEVEFGPKRIEFPMFATYDSFKPQAADVTRLEGWAEVDLEDVKTKLATVMKEAEENDPAALKRQLAQARHELAVLQRKSTAAALGAFVRIPTPAAAAPAIDVRAIHEEGFTAGCFAMTEIIVPVIQAHAARLVKWLAAMPTPIELTFQAPRPPKCRAFPAASRSAPIQAAKPETPRRSVVTMDLPAQRKGDGAAPAAGLSRPQQHILNRLIALDHRGVYPPSRKTLAAFCRVSPSSSGYEKNLSTLRSAGFIEYPKQGQVELSVAGYAIAVPHDDGRALKDFWLSILNAPKAAIVRQLIGWHPRQATRKELASWCEVSLTSSGFEKNLSTLKSIGAIDYPERGKVALSKNVMPLD